jgi:subtilisin
MAEESSKSAGGAAPSAGRTLDHSKRQFIITPRRGTEALRAGLRPMSAGAVRAALGQLPGLEIVRVLRPRRPASALSLYPDEAAETYVARLDPDRAELAKQMAPPQLIIEEDMPLEYGSPAGLSRPAPTRLASWSNAAAVETRQIKFRVIGEGDKPLVNVGLSLAGEGFPQEGRTDRRGELTLPLLALPGRRARSLFVAAPSNYWDQYLAEPELADGETHVVRLRAIDETIAAFPDQFRYSWGQILMGLDRIPESFAGKGVKIAIVDSGADTAHPLLRHLRLGADFTTAGDHRGWAQDIVGQGSHCAGIIAAREESGKMLRGFAPEAEIHVLKVFPGGQFSSLLEALDYCLELEIDVVNLSLAAPVRSVAVEQKLEEAVLSGIAFVAAAGNAGGPVCYPASSPFAFGVGAVGRVNEYPNTSWDATTVVPSLVAQDGVFSPSFTSVGQEVAVCAPGVAIVSTVPGGFEALSGTSVAAPHVTGLAALLLAHHHVFQGPFRARSQHRVGALFNMIRALSVPYAFGPARAGAGLPRLHGLEHVLQPTPDAARSASSVGNGKGLAASPTASMSGSGTPYGQPIAGGTVETLPLAQLYVPTSLIAHAWPVQALLESLRRQYLGS